MRAKEFIIEHIETDNIAEYQLVDLHFYLLNNKLSIYESTDSYQKVKEYLEKFNKKPIVGNSYFPISISAIPIGKIISIARASTPGILVRIDSPNLYFDFGKGEKPWPYFKEGDDNLQNTILCDNKDEQSKFIEWTYMTFDNSWKILEKIL